MTTLVIDRTTPIGDLLSFMGAPCLRVDIDARRGTGVIAPVINPDDYDNDTDYLCAIPGMKNSLVDLHNAPDSEFVDVPEDWFNRV